MADGCQSRARWPETTIDVAVGQMRAFEFIADNPGDWAIHCHKSHHVMNAMGHNVPTMIGVDHRGVAEQDHEARARLHGDGRYGRIDGWMEMPLPDNTLPMMSGQGPFGPMEMGGMFSVVKIREGLARNDYKDPGWYPQPANTRAYEWTGAPLAEPKGATDEARASAPSQPILNVTRGSRHGSH